jgi:hypothetical protein
MARARQLQICDRDDPPLRWKSSAVSPAALHSAFADLSRARLEDTIYAEASRLRPIVDQLRNRSYRFRRGDLESYIHLGQESDEFNQVVEDLKYLGIVRESQGGLLSIPLLYRPALGLTQSRTSPYLSLEEQDHLAQVVNASIEAVRSTGVPSQLFDLDGFQLAYVQDRLQELAPDLTLNFSKEKGSEGTPQAIVRPNTEATFEERNGIDDADSVDMSNGTIGSIMRQAYASVLTLDDIHLTEPIRLEDAKTVRRIARRDAGETGVTAFAWAGTGKKRRVFFGRDMTPFVLPPKDLDQALQSNENIDLLRYHVRFIADYAISNNQQIVFRPLGSQALSIALVELAGKEGILHSLRIGPDYPTAEILVYPKEFKPSSAE